MQYPLECGARPPHSTAATPPPQQSNPPPSLTSTPLNSHNIPRAKNPYTPYNLSLDFQQNKGPSVQQQIEQIRQQAKADIDNAADSKTAEQLRVKYLGRKGPIQELMQSLREVEKDQRPEMGKLINDLKVEITDSIASLSERFSYAEETVRLQEEALDMTLPGRNLNLGSKHILTHALDQIIDILVGMGFSVQSGPHIESDYYNFEALNMDQDHPARDMQDTFYIEKDMCLRTHTSNIQARVMENSRPPIRIIAPGRSFRNEEVSARSHVMFHQIEGLYIDKGVTFADLMSTLDEFLSKLFEKDVKIRNRCSYFPFVEPGLEVDVECLKCGGTGCGLCKHTGWLEVLGAGMVHPEVLRYGGVDPDEYSGYAWGMGLERLVLIKYGIPDIRLFTQNHLDLLRQYPQI